MFRQNAFGFHRQWLICVKLCGSSFKRSAWFFTSFTVCAVHIEVGYALRADSGFLIIHRFIALPFVPFFWKSVIVSFIESEIIFVGADHTLGELASLLRVDTCIHFFWHCDLTIITRYITVTIRILLVWFLSNHSAIIFLEVLHLSHITRIDRMLHWLTQLRIDYLLQLSLMLLTTGTKINVSWATIDEGCFEIILS